MHYSVCTNDENIIGFPKIRTKKSALYIYTCWLFSIAPHSVIALNFIFFHLLSIIWRAITIEKAKKQRNNTKNESMKISAITFQEAIEKQPILQLQYWKIEQKGMTFDHDFCYSFSYFLPSILGGKRKGEENNQSRGQNSCLSAISYWKKRRIQ